MRSTHPVLRGAVNVDVCPVGDLTRGGVDGEQVGGVVISDDAVLYKAKRRLENRWSINMILIA